MSEITPLIPVITKAGLKAAFTADNQGIAAKITHIALGDVGRVPSNTETKLRGEKLRIQVADGERVSDTQIHITGVADSGPAFWVKEIGFFLEDGTLFALWSDVDPLAYKSANNKVPLLLAFDLVLDAVPAGSITVEGTGADLSLAAWGEQYVSSAAAIVDNMQRHVGLMFRVMELEKAAA
ncbi:MAG: phage tail protein [Aeromonas veronii]